MMIALMVLVTVVISGLYMLTVLQEAERSAERPPEPPRWWDFDRWKITLLQYELLSKQFYVDIFYYFYNQTSATEVAILLLKYVPTGLYMYKLLGNIYKSSRERIKKKQTEIEDLQIQVNIVNAKLCMRDAEVAERKNTLHREAGTLRRVRARVRHLIASDDTLRTMIRNPDWDPDAEMLVKFTPDDERENILHMLKELKCDTPIPDMERKESGEPAATDPDSGNSFFSSQSDVELGNECRVKIVKVTNIYKVAYLKHYIKQKRLRRAQKHALLKKKMEAVKKLLEDWQRSLNMVIHNKATVEGASQDTDGDYRQTHGSSGSDSDFRNSLSECYEDYSQTWAQNRYRDYPIYDESIEAMSQYECYTRAGGRELERYRGGRSEAKELERLPEETLSQVAVELAADTPRPPDLISL